MLMQAEGMAGQALETEAKGNWKSKLKSDSNLSYLPGQVSP